MTQITQSDIASVLNGILKSSEDEIASATEADLENYWFFKWSDHIPLAWNIYLFCDRLDMYRRQCRRWEEKHNGSSCVVERVRDKYLMPKIREFEAKLRQTFKEKEA